MAEKRRVVAYRCAREEAFWAYAEAKGFHVVFADSVEELHRLLMSTGCSVVATTDGYAWTEVVRALPEVCSDRSLSSVVLLPLRSVRVHIVAPAEPEEVPPPFAHDELVKILETACSRDGRDGGEDSATISAAEELEQMLGKRLASTGSAGQDGWDWLGGLGEKIEAIS